MKTRRDFGSANIPSTATAPYTARRPPRTETLLLRGLRHHLYHWQGDDPQPVVMLHGWGDTGATWQFLIDHMPPSRSWLALDLRGFGRTQHAQDGYWFPDYLADLEALLQHVSPAAPADIVGHSMGGNIATLYAGVRPQRVRRLVNLEGFGLDQANADTAPVRYAQWLDQIARGTRYASYASYEQFQWLLARRNPRTPPDRLAFIARAWAQETEGGRIELRADPAHRRTNPVLYQRDQAQACWRGITAPTLLVVGELSEHGRRLEQNMSSQQLREMAAEVTVRRLPDAGHMLHHERPAEVAALLADFLD